jgi:hypothetical protein
MTDPRPDLIKTIKRLPMISDGSSSSKWRRKIKVYVKYISPMHVSNIL